MYKFDSYTTKRGHNTDPSTAVITAYWTSAQGVECCAEWARIDGWGLHWDELRKEGEELAEQFNQEQPPRRLLHERLKSKHYEEGLQHFLDNPPGWPPGEYLLQKRALA